MAVSGGEMLLNSFQNYGIEYIFCSPGTEWTPVWEGLIRRQSEGNDSLKYINCRHEILAVSMATGYAITTGRLPAVLLHAGVGTLSGAIAIRNAYVAHVPMIICSGETYEHAGDDEIRAQGWHWLGLLSDIGGPSALVKDYVKWSNAVKSRDSLLDCVYRGCQIARTTPQGPVLLSIPADLLKRSLKETESTRPCPVTTITEPRSSDLVEAARQLLQSQQPIIITEHTGKKPEIVDKLTELAELLSIPVFESSLPYFANFHKDNPLYMGNNVSEALKEADMVLVIGGTTPWYPPSASPKKEASIIQINETPWHENLPYWGYQADLSITADIELGLTALVDAVRASADYQEKSSHIGKARLEHWQTEHKKLMEQWETEAAAGRDDKPIATRWFCHVARKTLPADAIILDETLTHSRFVHQYLAAPNHYYKASYGGLGIGLGQAAGVKLANQNRPVVLMVGDGAFNYNPVLAGLGLCQEYHLPILIIVLNNGGYMAMRLGHRMMYPEGAAVSRNTFLGVNITPAPDYVKIAEAFDACGERLEEPGEIEPALNRALAKMAEGKTVLLDVIMT